MISAVRFLVWKIGRWNGVNYVAPSLAQYRGIECARTEECEEFALAEWAQARAFKLKS
jgi:hypothetical protein